MSVNGVSRLRTGGGAHITYISTQQSAMELAQTECELQRAMQREGYVAGATTVYPNVVRCVWQRVTGRRGADGAAGDEVEDDAGNDAGNDAEDGAEHGVEHGTGGGAEDATAAAAAAAVPAAVLAADGAHGAGKETRTARRGGWRGGWREGVRVLLWSLCLTLLASATLWAAAFGVHVATGGRLEGCSWRSSWTACGVAVARALALL